MSLMPLWHDSMDLTKHNSSMCSRHFTQDGTIRIVSTTCSDTFERMLESSLESSWDHEDSG